MGRNWTGQEAARRKREELLDALQRFTDEKGYAPTFAELAQVLGVSDSTVERYVKVLEEEGRVERTGPRTLRITF